MSGNAYTIIFLSGLAILLFSTVIFYGNEHKKEFDKGSRIKNMTADAMFLAIILIMSFVPNLGYISVTPFVSLTLIHLPVLLGAALGGWKKGLLYGLFFGVSSYFNALGQPAGFNAFFAFPWVAIPPRMLFGLIAGIIFSLLKKLNKGKHKSLYLLLASPVLTALHTVLVFATLLLFHGQNVWSLLVSGDPAAVGTTLTFAALIGLGMLGEMALSAILIPPLTVAVSKAVPTIFARE